MQPSSYTTLVFHSFNTSPVHFILTVTLFPAVNSLYLMLAVEKRHSIVADTAPSQSVPLGLVSLCFICFYFAVFMAGCLETVLLVCLSVCNILMGISMIKRISSRSEKMFFLCFSTLLCFTWLWI